jgi:thymidylate kinase
MRHLKPRLVMPHRGEGITIVVDPHCKPPRSALVSLAKILVWLIEEWIAYLFQEKKELLLLCDRYYHDLLIDPKRYRYGAPMWAAGIVGRLMPQPKLWVLLNAPTEVLRSRKQEVTLKETARQREAYMRFVKAQRNHLIVDASRSLIEVVADVEAALALAASESVDKRG